VPLKHGWHTRVVSCRIAALGRISGAPLLLCSRTNGPQPACAWSIALLTHVPAETKRAGRQSCVALLLRRPLHGWRELAEPGCTVAPPSSSHPVAASASSLVLRSLSHFASSAPGHLQVLYEQGPAEPPHRRSSRACAPVRRHNIRPTASYTCRSDTVSSMLVASFSRRTLTFFNTARASVILCPPDNYTRPRHSACPARAHPRLHRPVPSLLQYSSGTAAHPRQRPAHAVARSCASAREPQPATALPSLAYREL
jgi:hypothetical protein